MGEPDGNLAMAMAIYLLGFSTYSGFANKASFVVGRTEQDKMLKKIYEYARISRNQ